MKCYCLETDQEFLLCVEDAPESARDEIEKAFFKREQSRFIKRYPIAVSDKDRISVNFSAYAPAMFTREGFDWAKALAVFAAIAEDHAINWYLSGSMVAVVRGIDITPHDIDIFVDVEDFDKARVAFKDYIIEPFVDNGGTWVVRFFGRLCIAGVMIDVAADESRLPQDTALELVQWRNLPLRTEPLAWCYEVNVMRNRDANAEKIKAFLAKSNGPV